ncbi:hypothetical protein QNO07_09560 [Streptomyces sp. 549]|uniref:hypothetical protein n=1 Tax=Streptomyces sp. 549 TaxID=3049076 RepID=UPI0024C3F42C|nr:hypothetical protein [Streptomyces sp. 549]MDK1473666.1 hypothetical protein [Streptomyces sp. 549]
MIRIDLPDTLAADRLIEALYVAAGTCRGTVRAARWLRLAAEAEQALDRYDPAGARCTTARGVDRTTTHPSRQETTP